MAFLLGTPQFQYTFNFGVPNWNWPLIAKVNFIFDNTAYRRLRWSVAMAPSKKRDAATSSAGGKALLKQWRPLHEWRRFGCISDSCYGQVFAQPTHENKTWKCVGCNLLHHHACEQPPENGSLTCGRCVELKETWRREWEQQQPTVQVVQATAVLGGGVPRRKRVDAAQHVSHGFATPLEKSFFTKSTGPFS